MNHLYDAGNKFNLQGAMIVSGLLSDRVVQEDLVAYDFAAKWADTLKLTKDDIAAIKKQSDLCGYTGFTEKNLVYPPRGKLPAYSADNCHTLYTFFNLTLQRYPAFNPCKRIDV